MTKTAYRFFAAELEVELAPRRPGYPFLFVGLSRKPVDSHEHAVETIKKGKGHYSRIIRASRPDLVPDEIFPSRSEGASKLVQVRQDLAYQGFSINPSFESRHRLYVVNLDGEMLGRPGKRCVYVGTTSLPVEERISQHAAGVKAARVARAFLDLNESLTPRGEEFLSRWDAIAEETKLGKLLIRKGLDVWGPQGLSGK